MGAGAGGRLTLWLVALAVLVASGATGIVVSGSGPAPPAGGGSQDTTHLVGSSDQRPDGGQQATAQARPVPASSSASARAAGVSRDGPGGPVQRRGGALPRAAAGAGQTAGRHRGAVRDRGPGRGRRRGSAPRRRRHRLAAGGGGRLLVRGGQGDRGHLLRQPLVRRRHGRGRGGRPAGHRLPRRDPERQRRRRPGRLRGPSPRPGGRWTVPAAGTGRRVRPVHRDRPHQPVLRALPGPAGGLDRRLHPGGRAGRWPGPGHLHQRGLVARLHR